MYVCIYIYIYVYIYIHTYIEREREREKHTYASMYVYPDSSIPRINKIQTSSNKAVEGVTVATQTTVR